MDRLYTIDELITAIKEAFDKGWDRGYSQSNFNVLTQDEIFVIIDGLDNQEPDV